MNAVRKELVKDAKPSINNIASPSVMDSKDNMGPTGSGNGETAAPESVPEMSETDRRLQKEVKKMNYKVRALEEKLSKIMKDKNVPIENGLRSKCAAFTARLAQSTDVHSVETLIFDDVITNIGQGYNADTGYFTAPFTGQYLFSLTVQAQSKKQVCAEILVAETAIIGQVATGDTEVDRASASQTVVTSLEQGDQVHVRQTKLLTGHYLGDGYTVFTGTLLL